MKRSNPANLGWHCSSSTENENCATSPVSLAQCKTLINTLTADAHLFNVAIIFSLCEFCARINSFFLAKQRHISREMNRIFTYFLSLLLLLSISAGAGHLFVDLQLLVSFYFHHIFNLPPNIRCTCYLHRVPSLLTSHLCSHFATRPPPPPISMDGCSPLIPSQTASLGAVHQN